MDFSKLLSKQIAQKQRDAKNRAGRKAAGTKTPATTSPAEASAPSQNQPASDAFLTPTEDQKVQQGLEILDGPATDTLTEDEKLRKLDLLVRQEKKDRLYKAYLEEENAAPILIDQDDILRQNTKLLRLQVRKFFMQILRLWEGDADLLLETKKDAVKLLYKLRRGTLNDDMLTSLSTIVYYVQTENITKANEAYLKLSIGNVAWPIGVRDVGIHARAADAKIAGDDKSQLANIMKSEATRRWLISVKRIVNYCEQSYAKRTKG